MESGESRIGKIWKIGAIRDRMTRLSELTRLGSYLICLAHFWRNQQGRKLSSIMNQSSINAIFPSRPLAKGKSLIVGFVHDSLGEHRPCENLV